MTGAPAYPPPMRPPAYPYGPLTNRQMRVATPHKSHGAMPWVAAIGGIVFLVVVLTAFVAIVSGGGPSNCPFPCLVPPPKGAPLSAPHVYTSKTYKYQVQYYDGSPWLPPSASGRVKVAVQDDASIGWTFDATGIKWSPGGGQWPYGFTGQSAGGRGAQKVVEDYQQQKYPQAQLVYEIPGAGLGYNPGWGAVYDLMARSTTGTSVHARLFLMASTKGDTAVVFEGMGPSARSSGGHPNPSATPLASLFAGLPNGVVMPGDSPR